MGPHSWRLLLPHPVENELTEGKCERSQQKDSEILKMQILYKCKQNVALLRESEKSEVYQKRARN